MVLSASVASGIIHPTLAWPEYFDLPDEGDSGAFPSKDADMSGFQLEEATPESVMADLDALVRASQQVTLREDPEPQLPQLPGVPDTEWT